MYEWEWIGVSPPVDSAGTARNGFTLQTRSLRPSFTYIAGDEPRHCTRVLSSRAIGSNVCNGPV